MNRAQAWKNEILKHKKLILSSILFLLISLLFNLISGYYVNKVDATSVPDIILDNIPTLDLDFIFIYGIILVIGVLFFYPLFFRVNKTHIVISQFSLLILIRSFFVSLTHLSAPASAFVFSPPRFFTIFDFKDALFFSGHTAIPFLGYLLFKKERIGKFFLIASFIMALTVLFMHVHYSIDVFAAFFITYGSYKIGGYFFSKL
jgi:hypothetical protein